jgi:hypothetical protein
MIAPADEQARSGPGDFHDAVAVEVSDHERDIHALLRVSRLPAEGRATLVALLFADGRLVAQRLESDAGAVEAWEEAQADGASLAIVEPLARWTAALSNGEAGVEVELEAICAPIAFGEGPTEALAHAAAIEGYEQLCRVRGKARFDGRTLALDGSGRRAHSWGSSSARSLARWRSVWAVLGDTGVVISAGRPAAESEHGSELIGGHLVEAGSDPVALEQVRLSSVYDDAGLPSMASLELLAPDDEYPRRISGETASAASLESPDGSLGVSFLHWSHEGRPGDGAYQLLVRT